MGLAVDGANRPDMKMVRETIESIPVERPEPTPDEPQGLCLDKGYAYDEVEEIAQQFGFTTHIPPKKGEAQQVKRKAGYKARRWVVRAEPQLDEPFPRHPDSLEQEGRELYCPVAYGFRFYHLQTNGIIRIGS